MSGDKRSVATDALEVLGTVITDKEVGRDAIHLACLPVTVGDEWMVPGAHAGLAPDGTVSARAGVRNIGIIDPFLPSPARKGQKVLLVIYPRTIESLRHVWSHPDIPDEITAVPVNVDPQTYSDLEAALDKIGRTLDPPVSGSRILDAMEGDGYIHFSGQDAHGEIPIPADYWAYYERITGKRAANDPRDGNDGVYFSCGC